MLLKYKTSGIRYVQYISSLAAMTTIAAVSTHFVWTSPAVPQLTSANSPIGVTLNSTETSLIASLLFVGVGLGSMFASYPIEYIGRKKTLVVSMVPVTISAIVILCANSAGWLYAARIIAGTSSGLCLSVGPIYNAEISESDIRGRISNFLTIMSMVGNLYGYSVGPFVSYTTFAITLIIIPVVCLFICLFIPESPYYLVKTGKKDEARAVLKKLSSDCSSEEFIDGRLADITQSVKVDMQNKSSFKELFKPDYRKQLVMTVIIRMLMYSSGAYCVFSFLQTIMDLSGSSIPSNYASIGFGALNILAGIVSGQVVDRLGRKPLFVICCLVSAISLFVEGLYFYLYQATDFDVSSLYWLPLTALLVYELFVVVGLLGLPFIIVGEVFPLNVKGRALSLNTFLGAPLGVLAIMTFQPMSEYWGSYVPFWIYGCCCIIGFLYGIFYLPETKGKSLAEIQKQFQ
ncbi:facilitated trehalose transporter Tret1-like [Agrilus planipennis]|uniref:Facilitated trehalose transporter Tret1-like n=1 Tax=Agrilus planipennis TaxID=224129 RepID=A0A7F5RBG6_AGRPL|nr:facilitated trehalose transporter Tret1-like [Agrilus planipennis]